MRPTQYWHRDNGYGSVKEYKREHRADGLFEYVWQDGEWLGLEPPPIMGWELGGDVNLTQIDSPVLGIE